MPSLSKPKPVIRLAETHAEYYMKKNFKNLIGKLNTRFRNEVKDSSANSTTDESHILYYDAFLKYFIEIAPRIFVSIPEWALAYIQEDLRSTVKLLCKCVHTSDLELRRRLIQTISVWMMDKYKGMVDPWSWSCSEEFQETLPPPTPQQIIIINQEIDAFGQVNSGNPNFLQEDVLSILDEITSNVTGEEFESRVAQLPGGDTYDNVWEAFSKYLKVNGSKINPAHIVAALTKGTIPINNDIFFDAVQISNGRVNDAYSAAKNGYKAAAYQLCGQIIKRDFIKARKQFVGVSSISPVKLLAIYRAVKFIVSVRRLEISATTCDFNSEIREHNVYPTQEEREEIDQGIRDRVEALFAKARSELGDEIVDDFSPPTPPLTLCSHEFESSSIQQLPTNSSVDDIAEWLAIGLPDGVDTVSSPGINVAPPDFALPSPSKNHFQIPTTATAPLQEPFDNFIPTLETGITSSNYTNSFVPAINSNETGTSGSPLNFLNNNVQINPGADNIAFGRGAELISPSNHTHYTPPINFNEPQIADPPQNNFNNINVAANPIPQIIVGKHTYPRHVWETAEEIFKKSKTDKRAVKTGKYLFGKLFTHEQKLTCKWGGEHGTSPKYPVEITEAIFDALHKLETDYGTEITSRGLIETKVFVETGYYYRKVHKTNTNVNAILGQNVG